MVSQQQLQHLSEDPAWPQAQQEKAGAWWFLFEPIHQSGWLFSWEKACVLLQGASWQWDASYYRPQHHKETSLPALIMSSTSAQGHCWGWGGSQLQLWLLVCQATVS